MRRIDPSAGVTRRSLLSTLAVLSSASAVLAPVLASAQTATPGGPLPSWNDGAAQQAIVNFVTAVTREGSPGFVPSPQRIAVFDNFDRIRYVIKRDDGKAPRREQLGQLDTLLTIVRADD